MNELSLFLFGSKHTSTWMQYFNRIKILPKCLTKAFVPANRSSRVLCARIFLY